MSAINTTSKFTKQVPQRIFASIDAHFRFVKLPERRKRRVETERATFSSAIPIRKRERRIATSIDRAQTAPYDDFFVRSPRTSGVARRTLCWTRASLNGGARSLRRSLAEQCLPEPVL